ncbi:MAG: tRNA (N(6)-L-threonylcarbamoyladenosine(37)-C(2))-methylthiotransferase MtaB [Eubacteriales bacterium]|nr:tRNA (N(6)-L-threonylcarbamoyladenosine(37)-C(2))-methylthiotransferase MtaB [Eubacteriales bacterium]MDD4389934.1 tRNA (N(6)-L-threonylcarbamoyladenosine(37)-C(2))-methylthiotransferase MtaB [Eubacteriales bacterium]
MKIAFHTLGCKVNQYETEALKGIFARKEHEIVGENDVADLYIINTCSVTSLADRKSRQYIRRMKKKNPEAIVLVTGCYSQTAPDEVAAIEGVDIVTGTNEKRNIPKYVDEFMSRRSNSSVSGIASILDIPDNSEPELHILRYEELETYEETGIITLPESRTRAYIKIQEGCDRFCSYCIIPYARGKSRSRSPISVINEAKALVEKGFKEIILTGINTALYGSEPDFEYKGDKRGIEIIISLINEIEGDFRIRLSSLEPTVINKDYVSGLFKYDKLCHHIHLSAQTGSDNILGQMNRKYSREDYLDIVRQLKAFDPHYGITTDIIAGFPGESDADFRDSLTLIDEVGFCKVHAFNYSKRPGTKAAEMKSHIAPAVKSKRTAELIKAGEQTAKLFFEGCIGTMRRVLIEEFDVAASCFIGYTDNYIKTYISDTKQYSSGEFVDVILTEIYKDGMRGE